MKLGMQTAAAGAFSLVYFGLLLFLPAGTFNYWQAWVFMALPELECIDSLRARWTLARMD